MAARAEDERVSKREARRRLLRGDAVYGFMEDADVPGGARLARREGLPLDPDDTTYFLGRETLIASATPGMAAGGSGCSC